MDKISVIVPCYNVEKLVGKCIESILNQTIGKEHLEIILVNDASPDGTLDVLLTYEKKYPETIMVINYEENLRQGGARNIGFDYASGNYIAYVDSDDWIEPDMYEVLLSNVKKYDCEVAVGGFTTSIQLQSELKEKKNEVILYDEKDFVEENPFFLQEIFPNSGIWTKLYKREFLEKVGIRFPEKLTYEDNYWYSFISLYLKKVCYIPYPFYHYYMNMDSTVRKKDSLHHLDRLKIEIMKLDEFKKRGIFEKHHERIEASFIELFYFNTMHLLFTRYEDIPDVFGAIKAIILKEFPNFEENQILKHKMTNFRNEELRWLRLEEDLSVEALEKIAVEYRKLILR